MTVDVFLLRPMVAAVFVAIGDFGPLAAVVPVVMNGCRTADLLLLPFSTTVSLNFS